MSTFYVQLNCSNVSFTFATLQRFPVLFFKGTLHSPNAKIVTSPLLVETQRKKFANSGRIFHVVSAVDLLQSILTFFLLLWSAFVFFKLNL